MNGKATSKDVLIVEDERDIVEIVRFSLTRVGFTVREAANGTEALEQLEERIPDLVVLDRMLPGMDGIELCRKLRNDPETALLPIVMLTALGSDVDIITGLEAGADDYLTKPFHPLVLAERLRAILRRIDRTDGFADPAEEDTTPGRVVSVCSYCRRVKADDRSWHSMESYFSRWHELTFTHGLCADCLVNEMEPARTGKVKTGAIVERTSDAIAQKQGAEA